MMIASNVEVCVVPAFTAAVAGVPIAVFYIESGRADPSPSGRTPASSGLNPVTQPYRAALQHLAARESHRADRGGRAGLCSARVEDARRTLGAVHRGKYRQADLVDEAGAQERTVREAAAVELQALDAELLIQDVERAPGIELALAGEDVGDTILAEAREVGIGDCLRQHHHDRIAADIGAPPGNLAVRIEYDPVSRRIVPGEPGLPRI